MPALRELQGLFWQAVTGTAVPPALLDAVCSGPALDAAERLDIYAGMYRWRIIDALGEVFPRLAELLGAERFQTLVRDYLARHPSADPSIALVGRLLPRFLAAHPVAALPAGADLARLEWARHEVFLAADAPALGVDDLRAVPPAVWPDLRLTLVPGHAVLVLEWPAHVLWEGEGAVRVPARTALRVWRQGFAVYHAVMEPVEERALGRLAAGGTFAEVCEGFASGADAAAVLLRWVEDGLVARPAPPAGGDPLDPSRS